MTASPYLAPAPRQLDIVADTILGALKTPGELSTKPAPKTPGDLSTGPAAKTPGDLSTKASGKTPGDLSTGSIKALDARRRKLGVTVARLCAAAGIHTDTYEDARAGRSRSRPATFDRLSAALNRLGAGEGCDERRTLCQATLRLVTAQLARNAGWDPALMLSQDFTHERVNDPVWRQASRLRRCAIYLLAEGLGIKKAAIGHAIGMSRAGAQKAVAEIEAERDRSEEFDRLMQAMMVQLKGEM